MRLAHCAETAQTTWLIWKPLVSFWESGIRVHDWQRVPMWPASNKKPGYWVSNELPWQTMLSMHCHNSLKEEFRVSHGTQKGRTFVSLCTDF